MKELIKKLTSITGPSGYETEIRKAIIEEIKNHVDSIEVDQMGNLIARKGKKTEKGKRVMLAAHMDEIGVMATHITEDGFVKFTGIGGIFPAHCAAARVQFMNGADGVIYVEPTSTGRISPVVNSVPDLTGMYVDVGASSADFCPVKVGDVAAFQSKFVDLGDKVVSKALDDRIGCVLLVEILRRLENPPNEVVGVFTVQEEVGTRGAIGSAYSVDPDLGIALDITVAYDTPKSPKLPTKLGGGPAIKIKDGGMLADPQVIAWMEKGAKEAGITTQREILLGGSTDARSIQVSRAGVPSGCVSIATRYAHSPSEMIDVNDVEQSIALMVHLLGKEIEL